MGKYIPHLLILSHPMSRQCIKSILMIYPVPQPGGLCLINSCIVMLSVFINTTLTPIPRKSTLPRHIKISPTHLVCKYIKTKTVFCFVLKLSLFHLQHRNSLHAGSGSYSVSPTVPETALYSDLLFFLLFMLSDKTCSVTFMSDLPVL